jgi:lipopolysaccharide export system permease protein
MKAKDLTGSAEQSVKAKYDVINRVLLDATSMDGKHGRLNAPSFRLDGDYGSFGDLLLAGSAQWMDTHPNLPPGYLLEDVSRPMDVDTVASVFWNDNAILLTSKDQAWLKLQVLLHERFVRPPLDFALILLGLPLVVNRKGRNLFMMMSVAMMTVMGFFAVKTGANYIGTSGYLVSPAIAAWIPLLVCGPIAYIRYRDVQLV